MKKNIIKYSFFCMVIISFLFSCKKEIEDIPVSVPSVNFSGDTSLKYITIKNLQMMMTSGGYDSINDNVYIKGVIIANDESGNFYKTFYIQDESAGMEVKVNMLSSYTTFKVGQRVYIKCKGLHLGIYGGVKQLGFFSGQTFAGLPINMVPNHVFLDSLPGPKPEPKVLKLNETSQFDNYIGKLVRFENVHFTSPFQYYVRPGDETTNRIFTDSTETSIMTLRTSKYANAIAIAKIPKGVGSITGILSKYKTDYQFYIRDLNDVKMDTSVIMDISFFEESFASTLGKFNEYSVIGAQKWEIDPSYKCVKISGYQNSAYYANEDWLITPAISLSSNSEVKMSFQSAMKYGVAGDGSLKVFYSTDYIGSGNPNSATWSQINNIPLSTGNFAWVPTGDIKLPLINGNVYIAFKYVCSTNNVPTWEIKEFKLKRKM